MDKVLSRAEREIELDISQEIEINILENERVKKDLDELLADVFSFIPNTRRLYPNIGLKVRKLSPNLPKEGKYTISPTGLVSGVIYIFKQGVNLPTIQSIGPERSIVDYKNRTYEFYTSPASKVD